MSLVRSFKYAASAVAAATVRFCTTRHVFLTDVYSLIAIPFHVWLRLPAICRPYLRNTGCWRRLQSCGGNRGGSRWTLSGVDLLQGETNARSE